MAYNRFTRSSFLLLLGVCLSLPALAEINQWLDEHGNTHFGDRPPQNVDSQLIEIATPDAPPPQGSEEEYDPKSLQEQEQQRIIDELIKQKLAKKEAEKANELVKIQKCKEGRERLAVLQQGAAAYVDEQGNYRTHWAQDLYKGRRLYISDTQRPAEINKATDIIIMNCKNPGDKEENNQAYDDWYNEQYCAAARSELELHERSSSRSSSDTLKAKRADVNKYCK